MPEGTFFSHKDRFGGLAVYGWGYRNKQRGPFVKPLYYEHHTRFQNSFRANGTWLTDASSSYDDFKQPYVLTDSGLFDSAVRSSLADAQNKAKSRFNDRATIERATLGVTLAESFRTSDMLVRRAGELARLVRAIRRFDAAQALDTLADAWGDPRVRNRKVPKWKKRFADNWLEWSFGWAPLVGDIQNAAGVLGADLPPTASVMGSGSASGTYTLTYKTTNYDWTSTHNWKATCRVGATVELSESGRNTANRLGLVNLAQVGLELVPWSFVANWFVNLEERLADMDAMIGLKVVNPYYTYGLRDSVSGRLGYRTVVSQPYVYDKVNASSRSCIRYVGSLPDISLGLRPAISFPWQRCANAAALVTQAFSKIR